MLFDSEFTYHFITHEHIDVVTNFRSLKNKKINKQIKILIF